jgi:hypothetical protein
MKIQTLVYVEPEEEFLDSESEIDSTVMHSEGTSESVMKKQPNQVHVNAFIPPVHKFNDASAGISAHNISEESPVLDFLSCFFRLIY